MLGYDKPLYLMAFVEPDIWKIEGLDAEADCEAVVAQARSGGRDGASAAAARDGTSR